MTAHLTALCFWNVLHQKQETKVWDHSLVANT